MRLGLDMQLITLFTMPPMSFGFGWDMFYQSFFARGDVPDHAFNL